jgi:tetratricopeptide (TPR) repeat protein
MSRVVPVLCAGALFALGGTAWVMLRASGTDVAVPADTPADTNTNAGPGASADGGLGAQLRDARRSCELPRVDAAVAAIAAKCEAEPQVAAHWHLLAKAHLERALLRGHDKAIKVGAPTFPEPPPELTADLEAGLAAVRRARELGDDDGDLYRIEAGLMAQHIVGLRTALEWNGRIQEALRASGERRADNPHLHVALGLRTLLAPKLLGHDPAHALEHLTFAAKALPDDERPAVFAAMASSLLKKRQDAIGWLERAVATNPHNRFARVVLSRLRAGEDDPFGRDVTATEAATTK